MTRATGVEPIARKLAYHQTSPLWRSARGMPASPRTAKAMTSPSTSNGWSPGAQNGPRAAIGGDAKLLSLPHRQPVVGQGQHRRREQVLESQDADERPDDPRGQRL